MNVGQAAQMYPVGSSSVGSTEDELPRHDRHFTKLCNNMCENVKNIASTSSGTVSINISSTALSQTVPIMGSGPSGTGHTNPTAIVHVEETYDEPQVKRQKKCTSPVWDHYTKYSVTAMEKSKKVVQQWAKCNHCVYKARCESVNGTKVFWNHLKYKHSLKPGQQQLKLENNHEDGTSVVEPYRKAFERLVCMERRTYENIAPSVAEWEKVSTLCKCLKKFHDVTELFSGTLYPTANLFYPRFCDIKLLISEWCASPDTTISKMAFSMHAKFEKYWKKSNIALAVACFLDPRRKKKCIEFYMKKFYGPMLYEIELEEFTKVVKQLYDSYASSYSKSTSAPSVTSEPKDDSMEEGNDELENFLYNTHGTNQGDANDLDKYMAEPLLRLAKSNQKFDILSWWKNQQDIYPILSHIARDVLAMQVSTAASESAFNTGGRVIDQFRSHLDPEIVEALICTKDWVAASRKDSSNKVASIINDLEVVDTLIANMVIVDEEKIANDED